MARRGPYRPKTPLAHLRQRRGLTVAEAAARLGLRSRAYLNRVETGLARPSASLRRRMAALYGLPEREIVRLVSLAVHFRGHVSRVG